MSDESKHFQWLHISDLHVGMTSQDWLWPTLKHAFYEDMHSLKSEIGAWDLVVFSGDFVQRGAQEEFDRFNSILAELWDNFRKWGFDPKLFVVPGNHDIGRMTPLSPEMRTFRRWWEESDLHDEFFATDSNVYRIATHSLFEKYTTWVKGGAVIKPLHGITGLLPGDNAVILKEQVGQIGLIGLNSTWLQVDDSNYFKKLHIDVRQLLKVTGNDPHTWCAKNAFNIIVTHHPLDWLHPNSQSYWRSDINPPGRFDVHLFGHMHESITATMSLGGAPLENSIQAASLFGLQHTQEGTQRSHGYRRYKKFWSEQFQSVYLT